MMELFLSNQVESGTFARCSGLVFAVERFTESMMTTEEGAEKRLKDQKNISESRGELEDVFRQSSARGEAISFYHKGDATHHRLEAN